MTDKTPSDKTKAAAAKRKEKRLKDALRANLHRRKAQARARKQAETDKS